MSGEKDKEELKEVQRPYGTQYYRAMSNEEKAQYNKDRSGEVVEYPDILVYEKDRDGNEKHYLPKEFGSDILRLDYTKDGKTGEEVHYKSDGVTIDYKVINGKKYDRVALSDAIKADRVLAGKVSGFSTPDWVKKAQEAFVGFFTKKEAKKTIMNTRFNDKGGR